MSGSSNLTGTMTKIDVRSALDPRQIAAKFEELDTLLATLGELLVPYRQIGPREINVWTESGVVPVSQLPRVGLGREQWLEKLSSQEYEPVVTLEIDGCSVIAQAGWMGASPCLFYCRDDVKPARGIK